MYKFDKNRKEFCTLESEDSVVQFTHFEEDGTWRMWIQIGIKQSNIDFKKGDLVRLKKWVDYELRRLNK